MTSIAARPLRVLVVTNMWPTAGDPAFGSFVRGQARDLRRLAAARRRRGEQGGALRVCFVDGRARTANYAAAIPGLARRIARGSYDVVHAHHALAALVALAAGARRRAGALIVTHHGIEVLEGWQAPVCRFVTACSDASLVTSRAMARRLGLGDEAVVPCGIDRRRFRPGDAVAARAVLGLPTTSPIVAWVGAERPEKRPALAREAFALLAARRPDARLVVVTGRPPAEVATWLQAADALLLTSRAEGSPMVVKEALACGLPVVATDVGDVGELVGGVSGCAVVGEGPGLAARLADRLAAALAHGPVDASRALQSYHSDAIAARVWQAWERGMVAGALRRGSTLRRAAQDGMQHRGGRWRR